MTKSKSDFEEMLASIARAHLPDVKARETLNLEAQNSDSLDFVQVSIASIRAALEDAYSCGYADATKELTKDD